MRQLPEAVLARIEIVDKPQVSAEFWVEGMMEAVCYTGDFAGLKRVVQTLEITHGDPGKA